MKKLNLDIQRFASTNKTANYDLPQFIGTDKPTWLGDFNQAMFDIDAGMHTNATNIESIETIAQNASASASQASQDVAGLTSTVNTLSSNVTSVTATANNAQQTATSALNTANTANGKADTNASNITALTTRVSTNETNIDNLTGTILWTNPNITSSFASQTITLSSSDYDVLEIFYIDYTQDNRVMSQRFIKGRNTLLNALFTIEANMYMGARAVSYTSDTSLTIGNCRKIIDNSVIVTPSIVNNWIVPQYVIGYKTNLFS